MTPTSTQLTEYLALDGPVGPAGAVALGVGLLAVFGWSLWRERWILGTRNLALFWILRAVALGTVLWILLAPKNVRVETSTTRRSVALLTDVSGSMQTVDPAGTDDELRWSIAARDAQTPQATALADRAVAATGIARQRLQQTIDAVDRHQPENVIAESTGAANRAIERTAGHLEQLRQATLGTAGSAQIAPRIDRLEEMLAGPQLEAFDRLCTALEKGRTPTEKGWRESLPDLQHRLEVISRSLQELARQVAETDSRRFAAQQPQRLEQILQQSRQDRTDGLVQRLHDTVLNTIREKADVELSVFDESIRSLNGSPIPGDVARPGSDPPEAPAVGTDLTAVIGQLGRDRAQQPLAAVFLLSDVGHNHPGESSPVEAAGRLGEIPVYVVPIGNPQHVRDVMVQSVSAPEVAMRNDEVVIETVLQAHDCEGEVATVQLLQEGEVIDFREVVIDSGFVSRSVRFQRRLPTVGRQQFQVAVPPLEGEVTGENNYDEFEVNVTRSDIKLLLADELPRWEYRYLAQLFRRDAKVDCDELLFHPRVIATGRREESKTVPVTIDEWDRYDVVLLGDLPPEHLPVAAQESLAEYLKQRGGTLVIIAGAASMPQAYVDHPLEELLPVVPIDGSTAPAGGGYAFRVTEAGRRHHALMIGETVEATGAAWDFVNRFAPLHEVSVWRRPRPSAETLIAAVDRGSREDEAADRQNAFLCWQPVGRGKVVYLSGPETFRLRFLRGDRLHYRFWGQLLRWAIATDLAAGSQYVRIRTDKTRYNMRQDVQVAVRLTDAEGEPVRTGELLVRAVSADDERTVPLEADEDVPGEYRAALTSLPAGVFRVEPIGPAIDDLPAGDQQATASFTVQADLPLELVDTRCNRALARQIAEVTGAQVLPPTAIEEILALTDLEPIVNESIKRRPLWLRWRYLWLVFGCLQLEWIIRKWKGLS